MSRKFMKILRFFSGVSAGGRPTIVGPHRADSAKIVGGMRRPVRRTAPGDSCLLVSAHRRHSEKKVGSLRPSKNFWGL